MKTICITQARTGSSRFPSKILKKIDDISLLEIHLKRIKKSKQIDKLIVATTGKKEDNVIVKIAQNENVEFFRGEENDVLDRYYNAAKKHNPEFVVRLTSDCTLIDPLLIDDLIVAAKEKDIDYYSNTLLDQFPDGQDIEIFKFSALEYAWNHAKLSSEREHVTPFIKNNSSFKGKNLFKSDNHSCQFDYNKTRMVVDYPQDFEVIKILIQTLGYHKNWIDYTKLYHSSKEIYSINEQIIRDEGYINSLNKD